MIRIPATYLFAACCGLGLISGRTWAQSEPVTLSLIPVGGSLVEGHQIVEVEVFVTAHRTIRLEGGQVDLPCLLPLLKGAAGTVAVDPLSATSVGTTDPDGDGLRGPSNGQVPFLFGPAGIGVISPAGCVVAATPTPGTHSVSISAGSTRYIATFFYVVSDCAMGEFGLEVENRNLPPRDVDSTRFFEDEPPGPVRGPRVPIGFTPTALSVAVGGCCRESACLGELNQYCCMTAQGGTSWSPGESCPKPCGPCTNDKDCPDANPCTEGFCQNGTCQQRSGPDFTPCDDLLFCTFGDSCKGGKCVGVDTCPGVLCDEFADACIECNSNDQCNDKNVCTNDFCHFTNHVCEHSPNELSCDDGLFCTLADRCEGGACLGVGDPCTGTELPYCHEALDRCVECQKNADCNDGNPCTTDRCNAKTGSCIYTNNSKPCNDGLYCTKPDTCRDGVCGGKRRRCPPGESCNEAADRCEPPPGP